MNEKLIQNAIHSYYSDKFIAMIPNFKPLHWWECDVCGITKSHYLTEFEIKLSKSDFKADFKKRRGDRYVFENGNLNHVPSISKHEMLKSKNCIPKHFYFVVDKSIGINEVPDHAGLILAELVNSKYSDGQYISLKMHKKAPNLSRQKITTNHFNSCLSSLTYRYWTNRK